MIYFTRFRSLRLPANIPALIHAWKYNSMSHEHGAVDEPLIADETHLEATSTNPHYSSGARSVLGRPTAFIWALTVASGISGLLFGYEFVPPQALIGE